MGSDCRGDTGQDTGLSPGLGGTRPWLTADLLQVALREQSAPFLANLQQYRGLNLLLINILIVALLTTCLNYSMNAGSESPEHVWNNSSGMHRQECLHSCLVIHSAAEAWLTVAGCA